MITTLVLVTLAESPRNREAGDERARCLLGFMRAQDGETFLGQIARSHFSRLRRRMCLDPFLPTADIVMLHLVKTVAQAGDGISGGFIRIFAKS